SGRVELRNEQGSVVLEVNYGSDGLWPCAADGAGHSLVLAHPSYGEGDPRAWGASELIGGSPGRGESWEFEPLGKVVVNEFLAGSEPPGQDYIELYNASNDAVDLSGAWLSDDPSTNKYRIAAGMVLGPRGFISFEQGVL
ncbi:MAG: lamin tail domain-containing protein, partial [Candidatus Omnitrophica bacterium]|nr:lamin tail domain-containing protein [Candidatus Omnitrophota bacterium]